MSTRTKSVYSSRELTHVWANFQKGESRAIRTPQGNLYTSGNTIYSYGSHFPIAKHYWDKKGKHYVLLTTRRYSNTTAKHIGYVTCAIPAYVTVIRCEHVDIGEGTSEYTLQVNTKIHNRNLNAIAEEIKALQGKLAKARINKAYYAGEINRQIANARAYCALFRIRRKFDSAESFVRSYDLAIAKERKAKEAKERKEREELETARELALPVFQAQRDAWIAGSNPAIPLIESPHYHAIHKLYSHYSWERETDTSLRLRPNDPDMVETSHGASFPARHCERVYRFWKALITTGQTYTRGVSSEFPRIGDFQIDRIDESGNIHAGCHTITPEEIERFASVLGISISSPEKAEVT